METLTSITATTARIITAILKFFSSSDKSTKKIGSGKWTRDKSLYLKWKDFRFELGCKTIENYQNEK